MKQIYILVVLIGFFTQVSAQQNHPIVKKLMIIDAEYDVALQPLNQLLDISSFGSATRPKINIQAITESDFQGSLVFELNGEVLAVENSAPYTLFGSKNGNIAGWTPKLGNYTLKITPYALKDGKGKAGKPFVFAFTFIKTTRVQRHNVFSNATEEVLGFTQF